MRIAARTFRMGIAIFAFVLSPMASAQSPADAAAWREPVAIFLQDYRAEKECANIFADINIGCAPITRALLAFDEKHFRARLEEQYSVLRSMLPELDIPKLVRETFCEKLAEIPEPDCATIDVVRASASGSAAPKYSLALRISINYYEEMGRRGLRVIITPQVIEGAATPLPPAFYVWYDTPAPDGLKGNPLARDATSSQDKAARDYWFEGAPSRLESELRQAMADTATLTRLMLAHHAQEANAPEFTAWWSKLPTLAELRAAGTLHCRGMQCRSPFISVGDTRLWYGPDSGSIVVRSAPLSMFQK